MTPRVHSSAFYLDSRLTERTKGAVRQMSVLPFYFLPQSKAWSCPTIQGMDTVASPGSVEWSMP
jgi:hypothetical protein